MLSLKGDISWFNIIANIIDISFINTLLRVLVEAYRGSPSLALLPNGISCAKEI
jgi:hypothetical protein